MTTHAGDIKIANLLATARATKEASEKNAPQLIIQYSIM